MTILYIIFTVFSLVCYTLIIKINQTVLVTRIIKLKIFKSFSKAIHSEIHTIWLLIFLPPRTSKARLSIKQCVISQYIAQSQDAPVLHAMASDSNHNGQQSPHPCGIRSKTPSARLKLK